MRYVRIAFHTLLWLGVIAFVGEQLFAPPSLWISIRKIYIHDGEVGGPSPLVSVDEAIYRDFIVHWDVVIRRVDPNDRSKFTNFCETRGTSHEYPGRQLPPNVDVDFWMVRGSRPCPPFTAGHYYAEVIGEWDDVFVWRHLVFDTNVFEISTPEVPPPPQVVVQKSVVVEKETPVIIRKNKTVVIKQQSFSLFGPLARQPARQPRHRVR